jgi:hypothetical protein
MHIIYGISMKSRELKYCDIMDGSWKNGTRRIVRW